MVRVAVLEVFDAAMQATIRCHAGPGLELAFAASNGDAFEIEPLASGAALLTAPNTILSPHVAGRTRDNLRRMVQHWAGQPD